MRIEPDGIDLEWFALDQDGHLAMFTSGGSRVVPESVLTSSKTLDAIYQGVRSLPKINSRWFGKANRWMDIADRGLYLYDFHSFDNNHFLEGEYRRIAVPSKKITVDRLTPELGNSIRGMTMPLICFSTTKAIPKQTILAPSS